MGWNTTIIIMNDALNLIEQDKDFGAKLASAVRGAVMPPEVRSRDIAAQAPGGGCYCNAASVVETHHMDEVVSVDVGGNTAVVVGSRYDPSFPGPADHEGHTCHACGREHVGYEEKYCKICGKAAQERKTLYDALQMIGIATSNSEDEAAQRAREIAIEASIAAPVGERMGVLPWREIHSGEIGIDEAYEQLEERKLERKEAACKRKGEV